MDVSATIHQTAQSLQGMMFLGVFAVMSAGLVAFAHGKAANDTLLPTDVELCFDLVYKCLNKEVPNDMCSRLKNVDGKYIIAPEDVDYFKDLLIELVHNGNKRSKRYAYVQQRVRKEVRTLSSDEWRRFVDAGIYDRIAIIHQGFERIIRNIGATASLISKEFVKRVLSRRYHAEITDKRKPEYFLEGYHHGPHLWCDGQISILSQTAEDPLFWSHHAYIDMLWQKFREQQMSRGVKPFNDYPDVQGPQNANEPMDPFRVSNRNGYSEFWIDNYYRYEPSPDKCSANYQQQQDYLNTQCGTQNLVCDHKLGRCVAKEGQTGTRPSILPTLRLGTRFPFERRFIDSRTSGILVPLKKMYGKRPRPTGRPVVPLAELLDFINDHDPHRRWKRSVHSDSFDAAQKMCLDVKKRA
ncbi:hypothetical protein KUTeg_019276 [Tegillarca granosa]|uniref:Tyrosinase copper-binding domain-containing protein n=1 Tax=Tegillarca granosa TaxID=220873 RepID=A0ABQ9EHH5_TEGGR|nr:hypothetical protein KUTeg_019276 [Tegillarca granosa]